MESLIHGTNVYPNMLFRGNGATGTVVDDDHSLITRQQNGAEGTPVADRVLGQAVRCPNPNDPARLWRAGVLATAGQVLPAVCIDVAL